MKIIIAGEQEKLGSMLTRWLVSEGHEIILIDRQKEVLESCSEKFDILAVQGNCAAVNTLKQTGVEDSEVIIAVTGSDEFNLLCCLTAHSLNPDIHTIARIRNPEYREIDKLLKYPGFLRRDTFAKGRAEIVELKVKPGSPMENISLMDLNNILKSKVLVCAINRGGVVSAPSGDFVFQTGDHFFVTGSRDELTRMLKHIGVITRKVKSVMLCGGGKVAYYLAKILSESGVQVELIERDLDRCEHLAEVLPGMEALEFKVDADTRNIDVPLKDMNLKKVFLSHVLLEVES